MYMVPGLWDAPLKSIGAFFASAINPPFRSLIRREDAAAPVNNPGDNQPHKYAAYLIDLQDLTLFDYAEALAYTKKVHKPLMIDFIGHACVLSPNGSQFMAR